MNRTCDIIIPTYNNADTLPLVITAIQEQHIPKQWTVRILVCDDGSTTAGDGPGAAPPSPSRYSDAVGWGKGPAGPAVVLMPGPHRGAAAARNRGIAASNATIILFLGADIILRPGALAAHLTFHEQHPEDVAAALGMVQWDPRLRPSPLMEWLIHGGHQNNFDATLGSHVVDAEDFFYASHLSLKRSFLTTERFDESYAGYGDEDRDLGRRLKAQGLQLYVLHHANGLHRHRYSPSMVFRRQHAVGISKRLFIKRWELPTGLTTRHWVQHWVYPVGISMVLRESMRFLGERISVPKLFAHVVNYEYRRGLIGS